MSESCLVSISNALEEFKAPGSGSIFPDRSVEHWPEVLRVYSETHLTCLQTASDLLSACCGVLGSAHCAQFTKISRNLQVQPESTLVAKG